MFLNQRVTVNFKRVVGLVQNNYYGVFLMKLALRKACKWWKSSVAGRGDFFLWKTGREVFWLRDVALDQCFSTFFDSRHPLLAFKQFGGTPTSNLLVNTSQFRKLAAPIEFSKAP